MNVERIDPEILAAFLEGKLEPAERERVLRIIAENPEEYEVFSDADRIQAELEGRGAEVISIATPRRRTRWLVAVPALIAAGIAAVVVVPRLGSGGGVSPVALAARLRVVDAPGDGSLARRLGPAWDQPGWSVMRGDASDVIEAARAFRLGARATDVEFAIGAGDSLALRSVVGELAGLASGVDGGAAAAGLYRRIRERGVGVPMSERTSASAALRGLMGESPWFDLGAWIEAARVAVAAGQPAFARERIGALRKLTAALAARPAGESGEVLGMLRELESRLAAAEIDPIREQLSRIIVAAGR